jgi:hypothetical protein
MIATKSAECSVQPPRRADPAWSESGPILDVRELRGPPGSERGHRAHQADQHGSNRWDRGIDHRRESSGSRGVCADRDYHVCIAAMDLGSRTGRSGPSFQRRMVTISLKRVTSFRASTYTAEGTWPNWAFLSSCHKKCAFFCALLSRSKQCLE